MQQLVHPDWRGRKTSLLPREINGNGEWKWGQEMGPDSHPILLLTTAGLERWAMENGEGSPPAASRARGARAMST